VGAGAGRHIPSPGRKWAAAGITLPRGAEEWDAFRRLPFTAKAELVEDQQAAPPFGTDLTYPLERYVRLHQTSGTTGRPLRWLDTIESWSWWLDCWRSVYARAGVAASDRVFVAFSFGPFIGFSTAFEAAQRRSGSARAPSAAARSRPKNGSSRCARAAPPCWSRRRPTRCGSPTSPQHRADRRATSACASRSMPASRERACRTSVVASRKRGAL